MYVCMYMYEKTYFPKLHFTPKLLLYCMNIILSIVSASQVYKFMSYFW